MSKHLTGNPDLMMTFRITAKIETGTLPDPETGISRELRHVVQGTLLVEGDALGDLVREPLNMGMPLPLEVWRFVEVDDILVFNLSSNVHRPSLPQPTDN